MFAPERHRELATLLDVQSADQVIDLGCGPGNDYAVLARKT